MFDDGCPGCREPNVDGGCQSKWVNICTIEVSFVI
jgi:hypothetical protein